MLHIWFLMYANDFLHGHVHLLISRWCTPIFTDTRQADQEHFCTEHALRWVAVFQIYDNGIEICREKCEKIINVFSRLFQVLLLCGRVTEQITPISQPHILNRSRNVCLCVFLISVVYLFIFAQNLPNKLTRFSTNRFIRKVHKCWVKDVLWARNMY